MGTKQDKRGRSPGEKLAATENLYRDLRQRILCGSLGPGQALPTESELMAEHDLNRRSIRKVLGTLVSEQLISRSPGRCLLGTGLGC